MAKRAAPKESAARKIVDDLLVHLGWVTKEADPDCNVFTEGAKTKAQERLLKKKRPDYVLYQFLTDRPIAVVEAKRPGKTLGEAIAKAHDEYAKPLKVDIVFATDGALCQSFDRRAAGPCSWMASPFWTCFPMASFFSLQTKDQVSLRQPSYGRRSIS